MTQLDGNIRAAVYGAWALLPHQKQPEMEVRLLLIILILEELLKQKGVDPKQAIGIIDKTKEAEPTSTKKTDRENKEPKKQPTSSKRTTTSKKPTKDKTTTTGKVSTRKEDQEETKVSTKKKDKEKTNVSSKDNNDNDNNTSSSRDNEDNTGDSTVTSDVEEEELTGRHEDTEKSKESSDTEKTDSDKTSTEKNNDASSKKDKEKETIIIPGSGGADPDREEENKGDSQDKEQSPSEKNKEEANRKKKQEEEESVIEKTKAAIEDILNKLPGIELPLPFPIIIGGVEIEEVITGIFGREILEEVKERQDRKDEEKGKYQTARSQVMDEVYELRQKGYTIDEIIAILTTQKTKTGASEYIKRAIEAIIESLKKNEEWR